MIKKLSRKEIYRDKWLTFYQDQVSYPDNSVHTYAWAKRTNGVMIAVITPDQEILLNKEFRYVINKYSWEIPGGGIESGESLEEAAGRELLEETGLHINHFQKLGEFYPLNSFNTEIVTLLTAKVPKSEISKANLEASEDVIEQRFIPISEARDLIKSGQIIDAVTALAIHLVSTH
jgi:8-oxo-dGTP pyrophosphatase MutT (NUDIX family)